MMYPQQQRSILIPIGEFVLIGSYYERQTFSIRVAFVLPCLKGLCGTVNQLDRLGRPTDGPFHVIERVTRCKEVDLCNVPILSSIASY